MPRQRKLASAVQRLVRKCGFLLVTLTLRPDHCTSQEADLLEFSGQERQKCKTLTQTPPCSGQTRDAKSMGAKPHCCAAVIRTQRNLHNGVDEFQF